MRVIWLVQDANDDELGQRNGHASLESEPPLFLADAINNLAAAIDAQNQYLGMIVAQNADLIAAMADKDEDDDIERDLSGRPL